MIRPTKPKTAISKRAVFVNSFNMSSTLSEDQINALKAIKHDGGICYKIISKRATEKGEGYMGCLLYISMQCEKRSIELILKQAEPTDNAEHKQFTRNAYLREINIYDHVLREFEIIRRENDVIDGFRGYPMIYGSSKKENGEYLILENLKENGFKMWDRKIPMDADHVALVFSEYGKFHATSLALREKKPELYGRLTKNLDDYYGSMSKEESKEMIQNILQIGFKAVESNAATAELFKRFADIAENFLLEDIIQNVEEQLVVTHADCWCNNMLFKYKKLSGAERPSNVCFIDWQLSKNGSPVLDLAYFLFVCTTGDILRDYRKFLKIYHTTVTKLLTQYSCDAEKLFPYSLLEYHWKKYAKFGLYIALMTLNFMLCETDVPNWTEFITSGECDQKEIQSSSSSISERDLRIIDIVNVMAQNGLI